MSARWGYSGDTGPDHWGSLSPEYARCSRGAEQSPIDLRGGAGSPARLEVGYGTSALELAHTGRTVEARAAGNHLISLDGSAYRLDHFHFHAPGEHSIEGQRLAVELHFVHFAEDGSTAVLGLLAREGAPDAAWARVAGALGALAAEGDAADVASVDLASLLPPRPARRERWSYRGSLTTPPCTEGVAWTVFAEPAEMSPQQIAAFTAACSGNARPVQPLGDRELRFGV